LRGSGGIVEFGQSFDASLFCCFAFCIVALEFVSGLLLQFTLLRFRFLGKLLLDSLACITTTGFFFVGLFFFATLQITCILWSLVFSFAFFSFTVYIFTVCYYKFFFSFFVSLFWDWGVFGCVSVAGFFHHGMDTGSGFWITYLYLFIRALKGVSLPLFLSFSPACMFFKAGSIWFLVPLLQDLFHWVLFFFFGVLYLGAYCFCVICLTNRLQDCSVAPRRPWRAHCALPRTTSS
jgi:hypothetical protein